MIRGPELLYRYADLRREADDRIARELGYPHPDALHRRLAAEGHAHEAQLHRGTRWDSADGPRPQTGADWWAVLTDTDRAAAVAWVMPIVAAVLDAYILIDLPDQTCTACGLEHPGALCGQPSLLEA